MGEEANKKPAEMDPEELPDTVAMQDEFTRDFLQSTEETNEGFYPFLSRTEKFKMDFPAGGEVMDFGYFHRDESREEIPISINDDTGFGMRVIYDSNHTKEQLEGDLGRFKKRLGYDGDFELKDLEGRMLYYTHFDGDGFRTYGGYISNEEDSDGIELTYTIDCRDDKEQECDDHKEIIDERAMNLLVSVEFINEDEG